MPARTFCFMPYSDALAADHCLLIQYVVYSCVVVDGVPQALADPPPFKGFKNINLGKPHDGAGGTANAQARDNHGKLPSRAPLKSQKPIDQGFDLGTMKEATLKKLEIYSGHSTSMLGGLEPAVLLAILRKFETGNLPRGQEIPKVLYDKAGISANHKRQKNPSRFLKVTWPAHLGFNNGALTSITCVCVFWFGAWQE